MKHQGVLGRLTKATPEKIASAQAHVIQLKSAM
jgi:hypothetical protein